MGLTLRRALLGAAISFSLQQCSRPREETRSREANEAEIVVRRADTDPPSILRREMERHKTIFAALENARNRGDLNQARSMLAARCHQLGKTIATVKDPSTFNALGEERELACAGAAAMIGSQ